MMMDAREGQTALPVASMLMVQIPVCFAIESMFPTRSYTLDGAHSWGAPILKARQKHFKACIG